MEFPEAKRGFYNVQNKTLMCIWYLGSKGHNLPPFGISLITRPINLPLDNLSLLFTAFDTLSKV